MTDRSDLPGPATSGPEELHPLLRHARGSLLEALVGQSPVGVGVFDLDARYVAANPALTEIIGLEESDVLGRRIEDALGSELGVAAGQRLRDVIATGQPLVNAELTGHTPGSEQERTFQVSYFRLADESGSVVGAASLVSDVTPQRDVRRALQTANARLRLLGRATQALSASLDVELTLRSYADLVVPTFADHCFVDLVDATGTLRRAALVNAEQVSPDLTAWVAVGDVVRYPAEHPVTQVLATLTARLTQGGEGGFGSVLTVPLLARGELVGVTSFATSTSGRTYGEDDLGLAVQLADRAALAIDNALLFAREQDRALVLQRSLLPALPTAPGLVAAARYLPAGDEVGGDWYDLIPLSSGRVAVVIGDVMGRGIPAAALMGQVRAAVRGYAVQDLPPADVLTYADELVRGLDDITIVTCVYAVYDPSDGCLELANAGHVPPLLAGRAGDQVARRIDASGPPLGAGGQEPYEQVAVDFGPHQTLVLYTDGLVESRDSDVEARIDALGASIDPAVDDLERLCTTLLEGSGRQDADDDLALLVLRPDELSGPRVAVLPLRADPSVVSRARAFVVRTLRSWQVAPEDIDLARLVASELTTNGVRYGAGHLSLHLSLRPDALYVEVRDGSPALPHGKRPNPDAEGGRGLLLVGSLTQSWGTRRLHPRGKAVWCRIRRAPDHAPVDERVRVG